MQHSIRPAPDSIAILIVLVSICLAKSAAPFSPRAGISRVLHSPGIGAFAIITIRTGFIDNTQLMLMLAIERYAMTSI
ncbi:MAG: hypothetical protein M1270_08465, partial [Gammaproteobacteria bacterium]|nr:hypothetical protein [Gammaproteobacteria bacterium]